MNRFLFAVFSVFCLIGPASAAPDESPVEAAKKLISAWCRGDIETIKADCNPRHPFLEPGYDFKPLLDGIRHTGKYTGELEDLQVVRVLTPQNGLKTVVFRMRFSKGVYQGMLHLTGENRFTGYGGPFLEKGPDLPELNKEQMLADYDHMVSVLREAMPHDLAIREAFGIDVWRKLEEYRSRITGKESPVEFAVLLQRALASCKGHHLWLDTLDGMLDSEWYKEIYSESIPPETARIGHATLMLVRYSFPNVRPAPLRFQYWDGNYYTAPEFTFDGKTYRGPLKLTAVDGRSPEELEPLVRDRLFEFDPKKRRFYGPEFYASAPSSAPGRRTFEFAKPEGGTLSLTIPDDAEIPEKQMTGTVFGIPKQVLFLKEHQLVYIRVPSMNPADLPFYEKELKPILEKERPRYAVIDIRGNGGGSDSVPMTLLEMLSANPIQFKGMLATPANARIRDYMKRRGRDFSDNANVRRIPFLADREFDVQEFTITMKNGENASAEHVYVIAHDVYSAAGTLVAIAKGSEHVTAVGFPGTKMLGMGIDPYHFALPNSKLIISVEPAVDLSNCRSAADTLHLDIEVELPMSAEEHFACQSHPVPADCRSYLENEDPFMQKIFGLIRERETAANRNSEQSRFRQTDTE